MGMSGCGNCSQLMKKLDADFDDMDAEKREKWFKKDECNCLDCNTELCNDFGHILLNGSTTLTATTTAGSTKIMSGFGLFTFTIVVGKKQ